MKYLLKKDDTLFLVLIFKRWLKQLSIFKIIILLNMTIKTDQDVLHKCTEKVGTETDFKHSRDI